MFLNNLTDKEMYIKNSSQDLIKQHEQIENKYKIRDNFDDLPKDLFKYFSTNSDKEKVSLSITNREFTSQEWLFCSKCRIA